MWIDRILQEKLVTIVNSRPVTLLTGARQTGKSSLLQRVFSDATYVTFDKILQMEAAQTNPQQFLSQFKQQVILDEIQYVPDIFRDLKICVDTDRQHYGKWILTGSQQFELMQNIGESLAGRIGILHLETLSADEIRRSPLLQLSEFVWKGGYPELWDNLNLDPDIFFDGYIRTYLERDLRLIIDVSNLNQFRSLLRILASRVGQLINYRELSKDVGVADVTIKQWVHALEISGLVYLLPPYFANLGKRLVKTPKIYFADHGLLCHLLGIRNLNDWQDHLYRGHIWENMVLMELVKTRSMRPGSDLFFYRDQNGVEIDFLVDDPPGNEQELFLIEAKATERLTGHKLNFKKVAPILKAKFKNKKVTQIIAANVAEKQPLHIDDYILFNPLHSIFPA